MNEEKETGKIREYFKNYGWVWLACLVFLALIIDLGVFDFSDDNSSCEVFSCQYNGTFGNLEVFTEIIYEGNPLCAEQQAFTTKGGSPGESLTWVNFTSSRCVE